MAISYFGIASAISLRYASRGGFTLRLSVKIAVVVGTWYPKMWDLVNSPLTDFLHSYKIFSGKSGCLMLRKYTFRLRNRSLTDTGFVSACPVYPNMVLTIRICSQSFPSKFFVMFGVAPANDQDTYFWLRLDELANRYNICASMLEYRNDIVDYDLACSSLKTVCAFLVG